MKWKVYDQTYEIREQDGFFRIWVNNLYTHQAATMRQAEDMILNIARQEFSARKRALREHYDAVVGIEVRLSYGLRMFKCPQEETSSKNVRNIKTHQTAKR